jgi:hypothetical protein
MDEELQSIHQFVGQRIAQQAPPGRIADLVDHLRERPGGLGEPDVFDVPGQRRDQAGHGRVRPAFPDHQVGGEVAGGPAGAQGGRVRSHREQQIGQFPALAACVIGHAAIVCRYARPSMCRWPQRHRCI